ncbi:MAG: ABC transporter ATP-binding protein [Thiotrichales bacterium]
MTSPVVALRELVFRWRGDTRDCLAIAEFSVGVGERVFLHGPSGSGKSTLLNLIGGVLVPQRGEVSILGHGFAALGAARRDQLRADHIGFVFQQFNLIPYLPVIDNVLLPCRFSRRRQGRAQANGGSARAEAERLLGHLDLDPALWHKPANLLSVGQQQRVAAARALIGTPELIVADEPTSALDAERQAAFITLLLRECAERGSALVFVSHDQRLAGQFDRVLALADLNAAAGVAA